MNRCKWVSIREWPRFSWEEEVASSLRMSQRIFFLFTADWNDEAIIWAIYDFSHIVQSTLLDDAQGPSHQDYEVSGAALWWISDLCHLYCTSVQWCTVSSTDLGGSNTPTGEDTTHLNHADRDLSSGKEVRSIEKMIVNCKYQQNVTPYVLTRMLVVMLTVKSCVKELILVS